MTTRNRRIFMLGIAAGPLVLHTTQGQAQFPKVDENEPKATAIGYRHDTTKVDQARYPKHAPSQLCHNCLAFAPEKPSDEWGECDLMSDRLVHRNGWCSSYKPLKPAKKG
jgi:hypothetical protein